MIRLRILTVWLVTLILGCSGAKGQFQSAEIGIDGLTCSMCSYGVQRSIEKRQYIKKIKVDLNKNVAHVEFADHAVVSISDLIQSVTDAGFSVRSLSADLHLKKDVDQIEDSYLIHNNQTYFILHSPNPIRAGLIRVHFVNKSFSNVESYRKYKHSIEALLRNIPGTRESYYFVVI